MRQQYNYNTEYAIKRLRENRIIKPETLGIIIDKDCVLTETDTGKVKTYHIFNYRSKEGTYLGYRKEKITEENLMKFAGKIKEQDFYAKTIPGDGEELIRFIFESVFTEYGFTVREDQVDVAVQMYRAMMNRQISLSDIPVGLGKTHAYLIASLVFLRKNRRSSAPLVITTSSIELQKAIEKEYIPTISKMLLENGIIEEAITSVQRKGKENYLCDVRLANYVRTLNPSKKPKQELELLRSLQDGSRIDLTEIKGITNYDKRKIHVEAEQCFYCKLSSRCRFQRFMQEALRHPYTFQICNHNYFFADLMRRKKGLKPLLPAYSAVVIDEAHKLAAAAQDMYGIRISKKELLAILQKAKPSKENSKAAHAKMVIAKEALRLVDEVFEQLTKQINKELFDEATEKYAVKLNGKIMTELKRLCLNLIHLSGMQEDHKLTVYHSMKRIAEDIGKIIAKDSVCWMEFSESGEDTKLFAVQKNISVQMAEDLFHNDLPMLLTSGTIAVHGDFDYFKNELGLRGMLEKRVHELSKSSPYDYWNNTILYQTQSIPYPDSEDENYLHCVSEEIEKLIRISHGHALVLFTSYKPMKKVYQSLQDKSFGFPIYQLQKGKSRSISDYRDSSKGVLFACGSVWEGIDFKGDLLSHLIIVKLPFLVPDPITNELQNQYVTQEDFREKILIPRMLIRLKQGYGRAVRSEDDTAVISVLDPRANNGYKKYIEQALPKCKVTHELEEVRSFFEQKKEADYFK